MNIEIAKDSPYVNGTIVVYDDNSYTLDPPDNPLKYYNDGGTDKIHQIVQGDTLESLAYIYYRNSSYWHVILNYNKNIWELENLPVGQNLIIPNPQKFKNG